MTTPNNPYARPINATKPEGQMLQSEYYGERAGDKKLAGLREQQVSPASRYVGRAIATPVDMEALAAERPTGPRRGRPPGSKNKPRERATIDDIAPLDEIEAEEAAITEDDLFG